MNSVWNDPTLTGVVRPSEYACPNPACAAERWLVQVQPGARELWLVAEAEDASPWQIAASAPLCPQCGTDLTCVAST